MESGSNPQQSLHGNALIPTGPCNPQALAQLFSALQSFYAQCRAPITPSPNIVEVSQDCIPDTPPSQQGQDGPSTSAANLVEQAPSRPRTRLQAAKTQKAKSGPQKGKAPAKKPRASAQRARPAVASTSAPRQEVIDVPSVFQDNPRQQSTSEESSSEEELTPQQVAAASDPAPRDDTPRGGKRKAKKKHRSKKSKKRDSSDSDEETGTSSSEGDSDAPMETYWGEGEDVGAPQWVHERRANSHRRTFNGTLEWKDGALVPDVKVSTNVATDFILGNHLSKRKRNKILNGNYVDMFSLLPPAQVKGKGEKIKYYGKRRYRVPRVERTFENWLNGYQVFMAVVSSCYPKRGAHLVSYLAHVRRAREQAGDEAALAYDEDFRRNASLLSSTRWDQKDNNCWFDHVGPNIEKKSAQQPKAGVAPPELQPQPKCQLGPVTNISLCLACSPIKLEPLRALLKFYPDRRAAQLLDEGFSKGFRIPVAFTPNSSCPPNQKSVLERPDIALKKIQKEIAAGRVAGPFATPPIAGLHISPLGIVPKKAPGEFRMIHNLSYPKGSSVNDAIPQEMCTVKYSSFDQAVRLVRSFGSGAFLAKCDIESAFRLLPVHPEDHRWLGFKFQGAYFIDKAMPMGCSIACAAFETFSTFLEWALKFRTGALGVGHYLDDFILVAKDAGECRSLLLAFEALAGELGVPLAGDKTEGPVTTMTYLGIELDTVAQTSRLPADKLVALRELIGQILPLKKVTLRLIQSLLGHLNFACRVISPGRPFCGRLARLSSGLRSPHHRVRLSKAVKADLRVWLQFLDGFNGISLWQDSLALQSDFQVHSDAAGSLGFGVYFRGQWCAQHWPASWQGKPILRDLTFLEFFPIVVAIHLWEDQFRNHRICFWTDNLAVVSVLNKQSSRSPRVASLLRYFVLSCLRLNLHASAKFVPGIDNNIADALSRFQMERFRSLAPDAQQQPQPFPEHLWNIGNKKL
ncbi:uncharacterized protein LOC144328297 [Podarcis muralis]